MPIETERAIAHWVGRGSFKKFLSVVVLSTNTEIIEKIAEALSAVHSRGKHLWKLGVMRALSLEDIIRQTDITGNIGMDFVVLALDTSRLFCLEWAKKVIENVHPDLRARRVILLNASGLPPNCMAVNAADLLSLTSELKLDMLTANVFNADGAEIVAQSILKYIEVTNGVNTGLPNLNV